MKYDGKPTNFMTPKQTMVEYRTEANSLTLAPGWKWPDSPVSSHAPDGHDIMYEKGWGKQTASWASRAVNPQLSEAERHQALKQVLSIRTKYFYTTSLAAVSKPAFDETLRNATDGNIEDMRRYTAAYPLAWLVSHHLMFVLRESVSLAAGWRQAAPWIVATLPASPILGTIATLSHKRGLLGDVRLAVPIDLSLPEALESLKAGSLVGVAVVTSVAVFAVLLIHMATKERQVRALTLLAAVVTLGIFGIVLFPVVWFLFLGRF